MTNVYKLFSFIIIVLVCFLPLSANSKKLNVSLVANDIYLIRGMEWEVRVVFKIANDCVVVIGEEKIKIFL